MGKNLSRGGEKLLGKTSTNQLLGKILRAKGILRGKKKRPWLKHRLSEKTRSLQMAEICA